MIRLTPEALLSAVQGQPQGRVEMVQMFLDPRRYSKKEGIEYARNYLTVVCGQWHLADEKTRRNAEKILRFLEERPKGRPVICKLSGLDELLVAAALRYLIAAKKAKRTGLKQYCINYEI